MTQARRPPLTANRTTEISKKKRKEKKKSKQERNVVEQKEVYTPPYLRHPAVIQHAPLPLEPQAQSPTACNNFGELPLHSETYVAKPLPTPKFWAVEMGLELGKAKLSCSVLCYARTQKGASIAATEAIGKTGFSILEEAKVSVVEAKLWLNENSPLSAVEAEDLIASKKRNFSGRKVVFVSMDFKSEKG